MHNYPKIDVFLDHNMKLHTMIELYLIYDNMHTIGTINAFICINNHVNSCLNYMLSLKFSTSSATSSRENKNIILKNLNQINLF